MSNEEIPDINLKEMVTEGKEEIVDKQFEDIKENMAKIKHKIVVISGKGGVGKTTALAPRLYPGGEPRRHRTSNRLIKRLKRLMRRRFIR